MKTLLQGTPDLDIYVQLEYEQKFEQHHNGIEYLLISFLFLFNTRKATTYFIQR